MIAAYKSGIPGNGRTFLCRYPLNRYQGMYPHTSRMAHSQPPDMTESVKDRPLVVVVDDDESVREALPDLLRELGYRSKTFSSAEEFLSTGSTRGASCLILDIGLPKMSGPDLQRELVRRGHTVPIIFITARAGKSIPPGLLPPGAGCLFKPFSDRALSAALDAALGRI